MPGVPLGVELDSLAAFFSKSIKKMLRLGDSTLIPSFRILTGLGWDFERTTSEMGGGE